MNLPIHESFHTWQGEGVHLGRSAFFIRTMGCPVRCPWCDAAGTWHPQFMPKPVEQRRVEDLVAEALASGARRVVVTGGEPAIHDLRALCQSLREHGIPVHLETSGGFPILGTFDWITVSPKWQRLPLEENLERADEIKLIVEAPHSIARWWEQIEGRIRTEHVWLHPEWSQRENPAVLGAISDWVKSHGDPFRAGWQVHKPYAVDARDDRTRPLVPLGGNPELGY